MTKKQFDLVAVRIGGYTYAVPKDVAMKLFDAFSGHDIYSLEERWESGGSKHYAYLLEASSMPSISVLNPATFHAALLAHDEREAAKAKRDE